MSKINLEDFLEVANYTKRLDIDFDKDFKMLFTSHLYSYDTWPQAYSAKHHKLQDAKDAHRRKNLKIQEKINRENVLKEDEKYDLENLGIEQMRFNPGCNTDDIFSDIEKPQVKTHVSEPVSDKPIETEDVVDNPPIDPFKTKINEETSFTAPVAHQNSPPMQPVQQIPSQQVNPGIMWYQNWIMETAQRVQAEIYNSPPERIEYLNFYLYNLNFFLPGPHFNDYGQSLLQCWLQSLPSCQTRDHYQSLCAHFKTQLDTLISRWFETQKAQSRK